MKIQSLIQSLRVSLFSLGLFLSIGSSSALAEEGNTLSTATPINPGTLDATLTAGDVDWFKFEVMQTGLVAIYSQGNVNLSMWVYNESGYQLDYNNNSGADYNFWSYRQYGPGIYFIRVEATGGYSSGAQTGDYTLTLRTQESAPLITDSNVSGQLTRGSIDFYRIPVEQTGLLEIYTTGTTDTTGILFNEAGDRVPNMFNANSGAGSNFHLSRTPTQPSTYLLMIYDGGSVVGAYEAFILRPRLAEELTESPLTRNLAPLGDVDHFTFEVPEYGTVRFWTTGAIDTRCQLYDSVGVLVPNTYNNNSGDGYNFDSQTTLQPGRYYLRVASSTGGNPQGPYQIHLDLPGLNRNEIRAARIKVGREIKNVKKALKQAKKNRKKSKVKSLTRKLTLLKKRLRTYSLAT